MLSQTTGLRAGPAPLTLAPLGGLAFKRAVADAQSARRTRAQREPTMEEKILFYSAIAAIGSWAAVAAAFVIVLLQNRAAKRLTGLQLFMQVAAHYDSPEMQEQRASLSRKLLDNPHAVDLNDSLLVFYENLAILVRRELLDIELARNTFSIDVRSYWHALEHYVAHTRSTFKDPCFFEEFEWLAKFFFRHERGTYSYTRVSRVGLDDAAVRAFLNQEALRGTLPPSAPHL